MYRPKPHILVAINSDGSGSVTQYESYDLAKVAYNALSGGTVSAFIYPKPRKSLSTGNIGSPVAIPAKVDFTKAQNATAIYNPGNPSFSAPHPDLGQFIPVDPTPIQTPPLPRVTTSGPFGDTAGYNAWQAFCNLNPTHPQCTTPGNPQYGTVISDECEVSPSPITDERGLVWPTVAHTRIKKFANGLGGEYEEGFPSNSQEGGCFYPQGFATEGISTYAYYQNGVSEPERHLVRMAVETHHSGGGWMPIFDVVAVDGWTYYGGQDGQGNQKDYVLVGLPPIGGEPHEGLVDYGQGSYLRNSSFNTLSEWSINGIDVNMPVISPTPDSFEVHNGKWFADFVEYKNGVPEGTEVGQNTSSYPRQVTLRFRYRPSGTISPFETVPSKTRAGRAITSSLESTDLLGIDSSETVQPVVTYEYEYEKVMITEMSMEVNVGQKQKARITDIVDGPMESDWSDIAYYPEGTVLADDSSYYYKATGDGGYYAELIDGTPECPIYGELINYDSRDEFIFPEQDNAQALLIGNTSFGVYADGECGTFESSQSTTYRENGYFLGYGDTLNFYSDGSGGYYTQPKNPPEGQELGYNISEPVYYGNFQVGEISSPAIADGNGGAVAGAGSTSYYPFGTSVGTEGEYTYYSDGYGGVYSEHTPPTITGYEGEEAYITIPSGQNVLSATRVRPQYSDGTVGPWPLWNYTPFETFYGSDGFYSYYSDGAGGYFSA